MNTSSPPSVTDGRPGGRPPALGRVYAKALLGALRPGGRPTTLPATERHRAGVTVDRDALADYARVCGFAFGDVLPPTYPHVLAFPLQVALMAERSFPLPLPGLVHLANRITVHRAVGAGERLDVRVRAERFVGHPKGAQVDLVAEIDAGGERVWDGRSTYLARGASAPIPGSPAETVDPQPGERVAAVWRVPGDIGRRYAAVSGDVNPIHLNPLAARVFGFPRAIAHGMWTAARALAALQGRVPDALTYEVEFRKPLLVPSTVELLTAVVGHGWDLGVRSRSGKVHLLGAVSEAGCAGSASP